jgi:hypothetical protein
MSMLSGQGITPSGEGRRRHPVTTTIVVVLMLAVLFGAAYGAVRLLRGSSNDTSPQAAATPCTTATAHPGTALPKPATVTINVYNATDRTGLAKRTSAELATRGFVIAKVANDPLSKKVTAVAELRYGSKGLANAQLLRYYLPGAVLVADKRSDATVDVVLGNAFTVVAPQAAVTAALAKPVLVVSGSVCPTPSPSARPKSPSASARPKSPSASASPRAS